MKGGIYSDESCPICGGKYRDLGNYLACPEHTKCRASRFVVRFGTLTKRFKDYGGYSDAFRHPNMIHSATRFRRNPPLEYDHSATP